MIRKLDCSVYYNNRTEKLLKLEPKKIQKSDENLRAELTHILLIRPQALVSFKKCMPPPLPYFKVNICPFPLPYFASIFFAYL